MKLLVYGAGVLGSLLAARMHEAGHDLSLTSGEYRFWWSSTRPTSMT